MSLADTPSWCNKCHKKHKAPVGKKCKIQRDNLHSSTQDVSDTHEKAYNEEFNQEEAASQRGNAIPLTEDYLQQVRPFIDLIDKLRASGLDQDVKLPAVAVIGDQSAGKSSTLEAISGIQLPRGKGIVTRCPLVLRLKSTVKAPGEWTGHIQYKDAEGQHVSRDIQYSEEVSTYIEEAQNAIAGNNKGISKSLITLDVVSEDVPDLTLIDLPGITRVAVEDQPEDIGDQIKDLITDRISQQETIILAVVPANVDIATNEALQLAKTFDENLERTLGVVTKPDLIDPGTESELLAVLNNERFHLVKGYTCIKCRGQKKLEEKQSLAEAITEEEKFFQRYPHFREVNDDVLGIRTLSRKLTYELVEQIKKCIPKLKEEVEEKTAETKKRLEVLGTGLPEKKNQIVAYVLKLLTSFTDHVKEDCENTLFKKARDYYTELMMRISVKSPKTEDRDFMRKVQKACVENRGNELPRFMKYRVFKTLVVEIIEQYVPENNHCLDMVNRMIDKAVTGMIDEQFAHLPRLAGAIKKRVTGIRQEAYETCKGRLEEIIAMEKMVFSQDRLYSHDLDEVKETQGTGAASSAQVAPQTKGVQETVKSSYFSVSKWFSRGDRDYEKAIAEDMCEMIKAFMEVSNRRMVDYVPMTISLHLIEKFCAELRSEVPPMAAEPEIHEIAREDNRIVAERKKLTQKLERLELAHSELISY